MTDYLLFFLWLFFFFFFVFLSVVGFVFLDLVISVQ